MGVWRIPSNIENNLLLYVVVSLTLWIIFSIAVGIYAANKGHNGIVFYVLSFFFSPIIGFIIALNIRPKKKDKPWYTKFNT